jgi:GNAT superfamily N-acetyltransferase
VPPFPELEGFTFRGFRGEPDYPHVVRIINAQSRGEGGERVETLEATAAAYSNLERCDPARDFLFAEAEGHPVAYSRVTWEDEPGGPRVYRHLCFVDPAHGRRGIGAALFAWNEARLREIASEHDQPHKLFEVFSDDRNLGARALALENGFEPFTYAAQMVRPTVGDLPEHTLPDGLEIRPVTEDQVREIWEAACEAFRGEFGFVEPTEEAFQRVVGFPYHDPTLWKVAWDEQGVAGQVRSFIDTAQNEEFDRRRGWTEDISTAPRWRRRGVAKALIVESIKELAERGMTEVALGVHTESRNRTLELYSGLGYELVSGWTVYRKPL